MRLWTRLQVEAKPDDTVLRVDVVEGLLVGRPLFCARTGEVMEVTRAHRPWENWLDLTVKRRTGMASFGDNPFTVSVVPWAGEPVGILAQDWVVSLEPST